MPSVFFSFSIKKHPFSASWARMPKQRKGWLYSVRVERTAPLLPAGYRFHEIKIAGTRYAFLFQSGQKHTEVPFQNLLSKVYRIIHKKAIFFSFFPSQKKRDGFSVFCELWRNTRWKEPFLPAPPPFKRKWREMPSPHPPFFGIVPKMLASPLLMLTNGEFAVRIETNKILADIISDEWPGSLYHDALVMTIG